MDLHLYAPLPCLMDVEYTSYLHQTSNLTYLASHIDSEVIRWQSTLNIDETNVNTAFQLADGF
jgi:hypothetical protein